MAEFDVGLATIAATAAGDLSANQYEVMRFSAANTVNVASQAASSFAAGPIGVLQNKPNAAGRHATIAYLGLSKVRASGSLTLGRLLTVNGSGRAAHAASGQIAFGRVVEAPGADGELFTALLFPPFRLSGAV